MSRILRQITFVVISTAVAAYTVTRLPVVLVLAGLQGQLHTTQNSATWVLTAILLSASIFTPVMGRIRHTCADESARRGHRLPTSGRSPAVVPDGSVIDSI